MALFPHDWLDELKSKSDIVNIASRYLKLERKGRAYWACCPFHHEKTPSFKIDEHLQLYYCFGCRESGNVITFVQKIERIEYVDAVKYLAEKAQMSVPGNVNDEEIKEAKKKRDRLLAALKEAARFYNSVLNSPKGERARTYLDGRGIDSRAVTRFGLGYSPGWNDLPEYMAAKGYTAAELQSAGLCNVRDGRPYDVFAGRLMVPIINNFNDVISFGGRILEKNPDLAKYRNGSQTAVFDKGRTLYAINLLRKKGQKEKIDSLIIVEGYMDVISLHNAGFDTALASMGTALTAAQARLMKNYAQKIFICYDGDAAGKNATIRGLDILSEAGLEVRVVSLPDGMDPDDLIKRRGAAAFQKALDEALGLTEFKLKSAKERYNLNDPGDRSKYAVEAIRIVAALKNAVEQEEFLKIVRSDTGYTMEVLRRQLGEGADEVELARSPVVYDEPDHEDKFVKYILYARINGAPWADVTDISDNIRTDLYRRIDQMIKQAAAEGRTLKPSDLYGEENDSESAEIGRFLSEEYPFSDAEQESYYQDCLTRLKRSALNSRIAEIGRALDSELDPEKRREMSRELAELIKRGG